GVGRGGGGGGGWGGKEGGGATGWKVLGNSMYGVLVCRHLGTHNVVAANQITAGARASAFAMSQALNAIQTVTDGCTYRRDQVPACSYARCLEIQPDYPLRRADVGSRIPFHDPATIPDDDAGLVRWYRDPLRPFFGGRGAACASVFDAHPLVHKETASTGSPSIDALATDGVGNYAKCTRQAGGGWQVHDMAMRGYGKESKDALKDWLLATYPAD